MIKNKPSINHYLVAGFCFIPTLLWAHPGHYHPDETDEFDTFQTLFFHSHGFLDYALAIVVLLSLTVFFTSQKPALRVSAIATCVAAAVLLPLL